MRLRSRLSCLFTALGLVLWTCVASARFVGLGVAPTSIISLAFAPPTGTLTAGTYPLSVCFGGAVTVAGGVPTIPLNTLPVATSATYASGSGAPCHVYNYTITANAAANPVATTSVGIVANGATFLDANGHTPNLTGAKNAPFVGLAFGSSGAAAPTITSVTSNCSGTVTVVGTVCRLEYNFTQVVYIAGSWHPRASLATLPVPSIGYYCGGTPGTLGASGSSTLYFCHIVWGGQSASPVVTASIPINLNGSTIQNAAGVAANLAGPNSITIAGLAYAPGNAYGVDPVAGNDSGSGIYPATFKTLTKAQTAMRGGSIKTAFLTGAFSGLSTTNMQTNTGNAETTNLSLSSSDNNEIWAALPGGSATIDGGASSDSTGVFNFLYANQVTNLTVWGLTIQNYNGGGLYVVQPVNPTIRNNHITNIYNDCQSDSPQFRNIGCGAAIAVYNWWTGVDISHNLIEGTDGNGIQFNSGESGLNGYTMGLSISKNIVKTTARNTFDVGGIYAGWYPGNNLAGLPACTLNVSDNWVEDTGTPNNNNPGIYLDDLASAFCVERNIVTGLFQYGILINDGGANDLIDDNIIDYSAVAQYGKGQTGSDNTTAFFMPAGALQITGPPLTQTGVIYTGNTMYNSGSSAPPVFQGLIQVNNGQPGTPTLETQWFYTKVGSYVHPPFCWAVGTLQSGGGPCDPQGILLASDPFVNGPTRTLAGFQYLPNSPQIAAGLRQPAQDMGLQ